MYVKKDLYKLHLDCQKTPRFFRHIKQDPRRHTFDLINEAINCCDNWGTFLDVGAYDGVYSAPLLKKFDKGVAVEVEISEQLTALQEKSGNLRVINGIMPGVRLESKIDFVLLSDVFEHVPLDVIPAFIKEISDAQIEGGVIYIGTPNPAFCGPAVKSDIYFTRHRHGHRKHYTRQELESYFVRFGYAVISFGYEEKQSRQLYKRIFFGLSRREKRCAAQPVCKSLSMVLFLVANVTLSVFGWFVFENERRNRAKPDGAMTQFLVLKKIKTI